MEQMRRQWVERAERRTSSISVDVSGPTTPSFSARVRNISASGMLVETPHDLRIGDVLTVRMPAAGEVLCAVVRSRSGTAGLRFIKSLGEKIVRASAITR